MNFQELREKPPNVDDKTKSIIQNFLKFSSRHIGLKELPKIKLYSDPKLASARRSFGGYMGGRIELNVGNRHIMDVLRTLAHELVHFKQDSMGVLGSDSGEDGSEHENEANAKAAVVMRLWGKMNPELFQHAALLAESVEPLNELNVAQTLKFIKQAHGDQLYGSLPYWRHPRAVALTGKKIFGSRFTSDAVKTAFLHDVVEDTHIGIDELSKLEFSPQVIQAVGLLTKNKSLTYRQNIEAIINSGNPLAMMVKYADNYENYNGDKSTWDPERAASSQKKYLMSLNMLGAKLGVQHHVDESLKGLAAAGLLGLGMLGGAKPVNPGVVPPEVQVQQQQAQQLFRKNKANPQVAASPRPAKAKHLSPKATLLMKTAQQQGIKGVELAQFLAQMEHESWDFKKMKEVPASKGYFNRYDPKHNPKLAKQLGNKYAGDGTAFRGRGFIQLTGRLNYTQASYDIFKDDRLIKHPDLAAKPDIAARIAVWYWNERVRPYVRDFKDTAAVTKKINGGLNGLQDRQNNFRDYMVALGS